MKNIKRWLFLLACIVVTLLCCSCQKMETMEIDTQLNINSKFDGERVMTATMPKSVLNALFDGDAQVLKEMIDKYCPPELGCTVEVLGDDVKIKLVVPFASLSEYKTKVYRILINDANPHKDQVNPAVYYDYANSMFKNGYSIDESFRSVDMFYWIITAVKTEFPKFADEDLSGLYTSGKTVLVFNGNEIDTGDYIQYTQMESHSFKNIHVYADMDESAGIYNGRVELTIARADYDNLQMYNLNDRMNKLITDGMSLNTSMSNNEKTYIITFSAANGTQYVNYMNRIFEDSGSVLEITEEKIENEALKARKFVTMYVNSGNYIDFSKTDTEVLYTITVAGNYTMENCESESNYIESSSFETVDNKSTATVRMCAADKITLVLGTDVAVDKVDVYTRVLSQYRLERQIAFYLTDSREKLIGESLTSRIKERLNNYMTFEKTQSGDGMTKYLVTINADSGQKLAALTCAFLDGNSASGLSDMTGGMSEKNQLKKLNMNYTDKIDFTGFLGGSTVEKGIHYTFEYPKGYQGHFNDASEYENVAEDGNTLSCTTRNKSLSIGTWAQKNNWNGMLQMLLWYMSLGVILVLLLINIPLILRCIKTRNVNWEDVGLFTHKGYVIVTVFTVAAVVFVITSVRLIFGVY